MTLSFEHSIVFIIIVVVVSIAVSWYLEVSFSRPKEQRKSQEYIPEDTVMVCDTIIPADLIFFSDFINNKIQEIPEEHRKSACMYVSRRALPPGKVRVEIWYSKVQENYNDLQ